MKRSIDGLVIWERKTGEADRVITILTPEGRVTAYAKGSLRPKNKLASSTAMLAYSNFELFSGRNMDTVDDASIVTRFVKIYSDAQGYALAVYLCELMKELAPIEDNATEYLSLLLNALFLINEGKKNRALIRVAYELRLLSISGYMPDLSECEFCGESCEDENCRLDVIGGGLRCRRCLGDSPCNCSPAMLGAMRHIVNADSKKIFAFSLKEPALDQLVRLISEYIKVHVEKYFPTLEMLSELSSDN